ncbi:MAG: hypothetical protein HYS27_19540 [Deltaproteobacteria bacterium]|nr:hypothetical protein [Deltaproteobacteria bacterium]
MRRRLLGRALPRPLAWVGACVLGWAIAALASAMAIAEEPAALPDALPPLDDSAMGETPPVRLFADARLRAGLEAARDLTRGDGAATVGIGGKAGVEAQLDFGRLTVAVGEAGTLGPEDGARELVPRAPLAPLLRAELALDTTLFGLPAELAVGRAPAVIADGRMLGDEPFDLRGRTLDGARARVHGGTVDVGVGAWWLGGAGDTLAAVAAADGALAVGEQLDLEVWLVTERDAVDAVVVPTLGTRLAGRLWFLQGRAATELQGALDDATLERHGLAGRVSAGARATLEPDALPLSLPSLFVDLDGDLVAGDAVGGRVLRAPAPTLHGVRGALDLLAPDNTWRAALALGLHEDRLSSSLTALVVGVVDRAGPLLDPWGAPVPARRGGGTGVALWELDLELAARLTDDLRLGVLWGIAAPGPALVGELPAQRLLVELRAATDGS